MLTKSENKIQDFRKCKQQWNKTYINKMKTIDIRLCKIQLKYLREKFTCINTKTDKIMKTKNNNSRRKRITKEIQIK